MAGCQFVSADLVSSLAGVAAPPSFAFNAANSQFFSMSGSFRDDNGAVCSFPTQYATQQSVSTYAVTPIIVNDGTTTTCTLLTSVSATAGASDSVTYSGFECPSITSMAPGTYTLKFDQPNVSGVQDILSQVFVVTTPTSDSAILAPRATGDVSPDGTCGGAAGNTCLGSGLGDCCSPYGWCGTSSQHCGAGCQRPFGTCATPTGTAPLPTSTNAVSLNGACGGAAAQTCQGSDFGNCCSEYGFCGSTEIYCAAGCQSAFGACTPGAPAPVPSAPAPSVRSVPRGSLRAAVFAAGRRVV